MKLKTAIVLAFCLCVFTGPTNAAKPEETKKIEKASYALGVQIGRTAKEQNADINTQSFCQGLNDGFSGKNITLTDKEIEDISTNFQKELDEKKERIAAQLAKTNLEEGKKFLDENKKKPGVVTLESGLQYKIITPGKGKKPKLTDTVTVHYEGRLINGKIFDSSKERKAPATFQVSGVIPGWTEILQLMPAGSTWEVYVPSSLAYGEFGPGDAIGPNKTLIFNINLISVEKS